MHKAQVRMEGIWTKVRDLVHEFRDRFRADPSPGAQLGLHVEHTSLKPFNSNEVEPAS